jgi:hypothetical protein
VVSALTTTTKQKLIYCRCFRTTVERPLVEILQQNSVKRKKMAQLTAGAHAANSAASLLQDSNDGLDNKDRWHWKERDLREWINQWLMSAFVQFDSGALFEDEDLTARVTTIRGDYEDQQGEAFLNWRKGKCFATYHFGMRLEFQGTVRVDGRIIGQSKGVLRMNDIKYDDSEEDDTSRPTSLLQGAWEIPTPGQQHEAGNKGLPMREPQPYEQVVKDIMTQDRGLRPVRAKLAILRKCLKELANSPEVAQGSLPDATINARKAMREWKEVADSKIKQKAVQSGVSEQALQAAEVSAKEYVENLRISGRSQRFVQALEDPTMKEVSTCKYNSSFKVFVALHSFKTLCAKCVFSSICLFRLLYR